MSSEIATLYSYWRSSCSWRVRLALNLKKIPYRCQFVHLVKDGGEQHQSSFMALNPSAQVPVLLIDEIRLTESVAILEYLEETRPEIPLLPNSPKERAQVRMLVEMINSGIQPKQNLAVINYVAEQCGGDDAKKQFAAHWIRKGLAAIEKVLETTAGVYCVGNNISFADLLLVPQTFNSIRFGVDNADFPLITKIIQRLENLPEFIQAHPMAQSDAPT